MDIVEDDSGFKILFLKTILLLTRKMVSIKVPFPVLIRMTQNRELVLMKMTWSSSWRLWVCEVLLGFWSCPLPAFHLVAAETREVHQQRKVVVHLLKPADFASPVLQDVINSDKCVHLRMECDRPLGYTMLIVGHVSLSSSAQQLQELKQQKVCSRYVKALKSTTGSHSHLLLLTTQQLSRIRCCKKKWAVDR